MAILERWFISDPALFQTLCTHSIEENTSMPCPLRSGRRKVEYNPEWIAEMSKRDDFFGKVASEINIDWPQIRGEYLGTADSEGYVMEDGTPLNLSEKDKKWGGLAETFHF